MKNAIHNLPHVAGTLAHEVGHNFGLGHNPTNKSDPCYCSKEDLCIMDAFAKKLPAKKFSHCQQASIEKFMEHGRWNIFILLQILLLYKTL